MSMNYADNGAVDSLIVLHLLNFVKKIYLWSLC